MKYRIENMVSGVLLGTYSGESEQEALDNLAKDAGYIDYAELCETIPAQVGEIKVSPSPGDTGTDEA